MVSIPNEFFSKYVEYTEAMINDLGIDTVVHYPPLKVECENCYFNTLPGVGASNTYRPGGPYPFDNENICPYCEGLGYKEQESTDTMRVRAYFDRKSWLKISIPLGIPDGSVWTIGYMSDLMKIKRAAYITLPSNINTPLSYTLFAEPIPWGLKRDRYFSAFWQRG